jgi:hypothetical protein
VAGEEWTDHEEWVRATETGELYLDLRDGPVWVNVFCLDNRSQHGHINVEIQGVL